MLTPPPIDHPEVVTPPFPVQVQRGELEAYGLGIATPYGTRMLRLSRDLDVRTGEETWYCHPHTGDRYSLDAAEGKNAQAAVSRAIAKRYE